MIQKTSTGLTHNTHSHTWHLSIISVHFLQNHWFIQWTVQLNVFPVLQISSDLQLTGKDPPDIHCRDSVGNTPLHCAAYRGQKQCIIKLLKLGASPSSRNNNGKSLMCLFLHIKRLKCCDFKSLKHFNIRSHFGVADQTALDLVRSDELRQFLAAYQHKVRINSQLLFVTFELLCVVMHMPAFMFWFVMHIIK